MLTVAVCAVMANTASLTAIAGCRADGDPISTGASPDDPYWHNVDCASVEDMLAAQSHGSYEATLRSIGIATF
jgi:hypothetical protein